MIHGLKQLKQINTNIPRETLVFDGAGIVIKTPISTAVIQCKDWLNRQKEAGKISKKLNELNNNTYYVPEILGITCK